MGLGCATFGREIDEETLFAILDRAFALGIRLLDTAGKRTEEGSLANPGSGSAVPMMSEVSGEMCSPVVLVNKKFRNFERAALCSGCGRVAGGSNYNAAQLRQGNWEFPFSTLASTEPQHGPAGVCCRTSAPSGAPAVDTSYRVK